MKKFKLNSRFLFSCLAMFVFSTVLFVSCDTGDIQNLNDTEDIQNLNKENTTFRIGQGSGIQMINNNQTDDNFIRGIDVGIPRFFQDPIEVKTGSWVTSSFSFQDIVNEGPCEGALTEEQIGLFMIDAAIFIEETGFEISFDGEPIDVLSNFRAENTTAVNNNDGNCQYILPWRYYINPQSKGEHILSMVLGGIEYSRAIIWVPGKVE